MDSEVAPTTGIPTAGMATTGITRGIPTAEWAVAGMAAAGMAPVTRRRFLTAAGAAGIGLARTSLVGIDSAAAGEPAAGSPGRTALASANRTRFGNPVSTPRVAGLHLQFGAAASTQVVVSWHSLQPVFWPRVLLGSADGDFERAVKATTVSCTDAKSGQIGYAHHAAIDHLRPATEYLYAAGHDGAEPQFAMFTTGPRAQVPTCSASHREAG